MKRFTSILVVLLIYVQVFSQIPGLLSMNFKSKPANPDGQYVFAVMFEGSFYKSVDFGVSYSSSSGGASLVAVNGDGKYGLKLTGGAKSLQKTSDGGATWQSINVYDPQRGAWVSKTGQYQIHCDSRWAYVSSNYGSSWALASGLGQNGSYYYAAGSLTGEKQYVCSLFNYLYRSTNYGASWDSYYTGKTVNAMTCSGSGVYVLYQASDGLHLSSDSGASFSLIANTSYGSASYTLAINGTGKYQFNALLNGKLYRSEDYGATWALAYDFGLPASVDVSNSGLYVYVGNQGLWRSVDYGVSWEKVNTYLINDISVSRF